MKVHESRNVDGHDKVTLNIEIKSRSHSWSEKNIFNHFEKIPIPLYFFCM